MRRTVSLSASDALTISATFDASIRVVEGLPVTRDVRPLLKTDTAIFSAAATLAAVRPPGRSRAISTTNVVNGFTLAVLLALAAATTPNRVKSGAAFVTRSVPSRASIVSG